MLLPSIADIGTREKGSTTGECYRRPGRRPSLLKESRSPTDPYGSEPDPYEADAELKKETSVVERSSWRSLRMGCSRSRGIAVFIFA